MPSTATTLVRPVSPRTSRTAPRGTPSTPARNRTSASFAAPSTGGAVSRTRRTSPLGPAISVRAAPGLDPEPQPDARAVGLDHSRPSSSPRATQSTSQATIGLKSMTPIGGSTRRMGSMIQSVSHTNGRIQGR